ncbi:MAG: Spy/CpxP family protein refolding chaperone [Bacteroidota bacterium]|nr:Spy/CpxP family protein refolding chaperone [Bacteroidota bacterium]MDP4232960.1 Spy/CpxP family protein refolding chaperone [Bacteroidota bacterium]MDP4242004.1 Spy/CpxP family protein refolding chaperone [Bacteroidota bacterium]MDP4286907.1 Spy/CpxP family protein refolding chaperone [Bacteroidota bacterium]
MKTIKRTLMVFLAAGSLAIGAYAAFGAWHHGSPDKMIDHMKAKLGLSDGQVSQIKAIYAKKEATFKADREAMKAAADKSDAKKAAFQKMRADREQVMAEVRPILTPEQQAKWDEFRAKHEKRGEEKK